MSMAGQKELLKIQDKVTTTMGTTLMENHPGQERLDKLEGKVQEANQEMTRVNNG